jgi:predicted secreted protein
MAAISGQGTKFRRWNSTTGAWADIGEITGISGPSMSRNTIDSTVLNTTGGYRTFIGALRDPGSITLNMNFTRSTYEIMKDDFEDDTAQNYEIVLPDDENTSFEFEGLVTELPLNVPTDDKITADVTIKISGQVTLESGSGPSAGA